MIEDKGFIIRKIKGNINETIIEFMLRELGFYVIKLGQEHKVEPIVQLEGFIKEQGANFSIFARHKEKDGFEQIRELPDFLIVKNNKRPILLEAKFRSRGLFFNRFSKNTKLENLFYFYRDSILLLTYGNLNLFNSKLNIIKRFCNDDVNNLLNSRFHIIYKDKFGKVCYCSFKKWLITKFNIKNKIELVKIEFILKKYENFIDVFLRNNSSN